MAHFVGYGYESDECSDESFTGIACDGLIPNGEDHAGEECVCWCHTVYFAHIGMVEKYHSDKHRDEQDGAYHNIGYVRGPAVESDDMPGIRHEAMVERILDKGVTD